jgi:hypothetical protein
MHIEPVKKYADVINNAPEFIIEACKREQNKLTNMLNEFKNKKNDNKKDKDFDIGR